MAKEVKVTCDGCGSDITTRTNSVDYRLVLMSESKPGYGSGVYTDMMIYPPIDHTHYFCGLGCLDLWTDRRRCRDTLSISFWNKWREEHGTKIDGQIRSWPQPPSDLCEAKDAEFERMALETFPMERPSISRKV